MFVCPRIVSLAFIGIPYDEIPDLNSQEDDMAFFKQNESNSKNKVQNEINNEI